ncbi:metallophosphoesterase [Desulfurobacterium thermolithotrophum DSM 11699]|uniref:Metallophosphoesterase n=1 Tax=Desulfurobacterium thermolithotrophum (strain DSM 11699 / BSA) TaxID=868864 RepID=F0S232_DESTD|nr:metallophosphoesterase family protein [Desulfurobacterium thermolithotrophum]ADY72975.1 metallophosphoesterase [Desulfurobacterium thermolithotrophum DSM 11699]
MKVGIISDIHGNIHALQAVAEELEKEQVDEVWCLGDVVGYGAFPNECLQWIEDNCTHFVLGNHELALLNLVDISMLNDYAARTILWTKEVLKEKFLDFLMSKGVQVLTSKFQLVHDTPESSGSMKYILTIEDAYHGLIRQVRQVCFFGHTHIPTVFKLEVANPDRIRTSIVKLKKGRYLINPGSVGQPRDRNPEASFIIFDGKTIYFRRVKYDVKSAAKAILKAGLPKFLAARLLVGV